MNSYEKILTVLDDPDIPGAIYKGFRYLLRWHGPEYNCNGETCYSDDFTECICEPKDRDYYCAACTEDFDVNNVPFPCYIVNQCAKDMGL